MQPRKFIYSRKLLTTSIPSVISCWGIYVARIYGITFGQGTDDMKKALLLIDIQNDFCHGGALAVPDGDSIVPVVNRLLPLFAIVIATKDYHPSGHISFASRHQMPVLSVLETQYGPQTLWPDHCVQGSAGADLNPQLHAAGITDIVIKGNNPEIDSYSSFFDNARQQETKLHNILQDYGVTNLYVCGLATDYCVLFSALDGLELGYKVTIVEDGCRGVNLQPDDSAKALARIVAAGGRCLTAEETIKELQGANSK